LGTLELTLEEIDVRFELTLPHLDGEEMIVVLFDLPRGILSEERFGTSSKLRRERSDGEQNFHTGRKGDAQ